MIRQFGSAAAAVAAVALVVNATPGFSAQSTKPKEIVVVGSKKKAKPAKVDALTIKQKNTEPNSGASRYKLEQAWPAKQR